MAAPTEKSRQSSLPPYKREDCVYTGCYCEENVWKLCERTREQNIDSFDSCYVVFLSNEQRAIPLWKQKNAKLEGKPVMWDYHVILLYKGSTQTWVFDLDTTLPFPCEFERYLREALGSETQFRSEFWRKFRVTEATEYLQHFASDRSHMLKENGTWMATPPTYPPISTADSCHNLDSWISMDAASGWGRVLDLNSFAVEFSNVKDLFDKLPNLL